LTQAYGQKTGVVTGSFFKTERAEQLNNEGILLSQNGSIEGGIKKFYEALQIEPENPTILSNIALNQNFQKKYKEAEKHYQSALEYSDSTYLIAATNLGVLYYDTKKFEKGIEILDYVIKHETSSKALAFTRFYRALSSIELGYCNKAREDLNYIEANRNNIDRPGFRIKRIKKKLKNCVQQGL